jgi:4-cresol dehydrogenase (hydroxylating)
MGPTLDPLFMQSNYGIVTKMGVWLMPQPQAYMPIWLRVWNDDDLAPMIDTLRELRLDRTIEGVPQVNNPLVFASTVSDRRQWYDGDGPVPDSVVERIAHDLGTGRWQMRFALYGDKTVVNHNFEQVKAAFERIDGAEVTGTNVDPEKVAELESPAELVGAGVPNMAFNRLSSWYGEKGGHIDFSPVAPLTGRNALELSPDPPMILAVWAGRKARMPLRTRRMGLV